jgi:hypothetical protein
MERQVITITLKTLDVTFYGWDSIPKPATQNGTILSNQLGLEWAAARQMQRFSHSQKETG